MIHLVFEGLILAPVLNKLIPKEEITKILEIFSACSGSLKEKFKPLIRKKLLLHNNEISSYILKECQGDLNKS